MTTRRLTSSDLGCWVIKTSSPPADLLPGWLPGTERELARCLRPSYRLALMAPGRPQVPVRLTLLADPVLRADLLADPVLRDAEVLRMPAGSNPSWLSPAQYAALCALGAWEPCAHTDTAGEPSPGC